MTTILAIAGIIFLVAAISFVSGAAFKAGSRYDDQTEAFWRKFHESKS